MEQCEQALFFFFKYGGKQISSVNKASVNWVALIIHNLSNFFKTFPTLKCTLIKGIAHLRAVRGAIHCPTTTSLMARSDLEGWTYRSWSWLVSIHACLYYQNYLYHNCGNTSANLSHTSIMLQTLGSWWCPNDLCRTSLWKRKNSKHA